MEPLYFWGTSGSFSIRPGAQDANSLAGSAPACPLPQAHGAPPAPAAASGARHLPTYQRPAPPTTTLALQNPPDDLPCPPAALPARLRPRRSRQLEMRTRLLKRGRRGHLCVGVRDGGWRLPTTQLLSACHRPGCNDGERHGFLRVGPGSGRGAHRAPTRGARRLPGGGPQLRVENRTRKRGGLCQRL